MYIAGLNLALTFNQGVEGLIAVTNTLQLVKSFHLTSSSIKQSEVEGGQILPFHDTLLTKLLTPVQMIALFSTPILFIAGVGLNGLEQPEWMLRYSLPPLWDDEAGRLATTAVRAVGCLASIACFRLFSAAAAHLGSQFHFIAVREKAKVVTDGPYAYVRHPLYSAILLQELAYAAMFWSYAPLIALGVTGAALFVKIPIEESIIENTPSVAADYAFYKQNVRARLIPHVW